MPTAAHTGALLITRCANCATLCSPMAATCSACHGNDLAAVPSSGTGTILSWKTSPRANPDPGPAVTAIVELDDGPRVYTWIEGRIPEQPTRSVRVEFRPTPHGDRFPLFAVSAL
ncbi:Zn-ribbon domain-containing OB-fold protein [Rhodococcus sp. NPDC003348]